MAQLGNQLGVPNSNATPLEQNLPIFSPSSYIGTGQTRSLPIFRRENTFQYTDNLTFTQGTHTLKFGGDFRRRHVAGQNFERQCQQSITRKNRQGFTENDVMVTVTTPDERLRKLWEPGCAPVAAFNSNQDAPAISGDWVVWRFGKCFSQ